jgi:hypothetical protein
MAHALDSDLGAMTAHVFKGISGSKTVLKTGYLMNPFRGVAVWADAIWPAALVATAATPPTKALRFIIEISDPRFRQWFPVRMIAVSYILAKSTSSTI